MRPCSNTCSSPFYFGIGVHIEAQAEYMDDVVCQRDRERLRRLAEIVANHGGVLTIQTQTPFDDKAQQLGDTIFADPHVFGAAEQVGLEVNINYKNPQTQQSDERYTILTPLHARRGDG